MLITFTSLLGFGIVAPILPLYARSFGVGYGAAGLYLRFVTDPAPSTQELAPSDGAWTVAVSLLRSRAFVTTVVLNMSFFWVIAGGYDTLVPLFGRSVLGMSTVAIGVVLAVGVATDFLMLFPAGTVADRLGRRALLVPALVWF